MTTNNDWVESLEQVLSRVARNQSESNPGFERRNLERLLSDLKNKYQPQSSNHETTHQGDDQQINDVDEFDEDLTDVASDNFWAGPSGLGPAMENLRHPECAQLIEAGVIAQAVLDGEWALPTSATTDELTELAAVGQAALEEMLLGNLRLALYWATRASRGDPDSAQDLFQDAYFGLYRAIQGWDWRRGYTFATYATWHVRQTIQRSGQYSTRTAPVHIPAYIHEALQGHRREGTQPTGAERTAFQWMYESICWERIVEEVPDIVSLINPSAIDELIDRVDTVRGYLACLAILAPNEADILARRHGLYGGEPQTLDDIGRTRGVTRERIRQLEAIAISKVKMFVAGQDAFRTRVIDRIRETEPAVAPLADKALLHMCLSAGDIKQALRYRGDVSQKIVKAIVAALDSLSIDLAHLSTTWSLLNTPTRLRARVLPYEPALSLRLID